MAETGLPNCGNTCFMSASFQMLYSMEDFRNEIMTTDWNDEKFNSFSDIEKVKALKEIFTLMEDVKDVKGWGTQTADNTLDDYDEGTLRYKLIKAKTELIKLINSSRGETQIEGQHDAAEFLRNFFLLFDNIDYIDNIREITELYRVYQNKRTYCKYKNNDNVVPDTLTYTPQPLDMIPLSFKNKKSINNAIFIMEKEILMDGDNPNELCKEFNEKNPGADVESYQHEPLDIHDGNKYIIISLNRFEPTSNNQSVERVNDSSFKVDHEVVINEKKFSLIGAVLHYGDTTEGGHYIYQTYAGGSVLNTYNDGLKGDGDSGSVYHDKKMTLNLNSYVLLYKRDEAPEAVALSPASTVAAAPVAAESGSKEITSIILNFGGKREEYKNFLDFNVVGKKEGGKKSRKPKSKKKRLRKTRRRKN